MISNINRRKFLQGLFVGGAAIALTPKSFIFDLGANLYKCDSGILIPNPEYADAAYEEVLVGCGDSFELQTWANPLGKVIPWTEPEVKPLIPKTPQEFIKNFREAFEPPSAKRYKLSDDGELISVPPFIRG